MTILITFLLSISASALVYTIIYRDELGPPEFNGKPPEADESDAPAEAE